MELARVVGDTRYPLAGGRALLVGRMADLVVLSVIDVDRDLSTSGPLALRPGDVEVVRAALAAHAAGAARDPGPLATIREALRRMAAKPMRSWDAGAVVDAGRVEELANEALEALARLEAGREAA
jgi:hypothetical protein